MPYKTIPLPQTNQPTNQPPTKGSHIYSHFFVNFQIEFLLLSYVQQKQQPKKCQKQNEIIQFNYTYIHHIYFHN